jgi:LuxR family transcriptional regulator, maltose regulon positive regulatory protein
MPTSILATKLYIPTTRAKVVIRSRLVEQLNDGLSSGRKLTIISAPAGFGKTTLVSEWVVNCGRPTAWVSLDEGDNDPARFLTYLITALQTIAPNIGEGVLGVLQSPQLPPTESILTLLLNEITTISDNFIIVLDDYHVVDVKPIGNIITFLLDHIPPQMQLVITTREDPNLPLARLRARGQLTELRVVDLRFTSSEAAEFLNSLMGLNLSAEDITALENRTEGWIAGLQLAALSLQGHQDTTSFIQSFTGSHHFVVDYLLEEVLKQQSENLQAFLLRTSILNHMCGSLCDDVLLDPSASGQETLEYLEHANLFIVPLDNERRWYRYHHLFADLLRQRLGQSQTPEEIAQYHICASEWYEKNGDQAEAFRHLIAARDFSRAAGLAERSWQRMNENYQSAAWLGWVKQLPDELIRSRPVLCTQIAWGFMNASDVNASESRLRDAERRLEDPSDGMVIVDKEQFRSLRARIAFARTYNAQTRGDFLSAAKYADLAFKLIPEENLYLRAQTTAILGGIYWAKGDLETACRSMSDWIDSSLKVGNFFFAIAGASGKADILTAQGQLREALRTLQQALELASEHESEGLRVTAQHYLGMTMLYHEMGDDEAANQHLQKSLGLGSQPMSVDWPYRRCIAQARLKESAGELEGALDLLDEAKRFYIKTLIPHTRPIDAIKARIYLKQGRLFKAEEWVNEHGFSVDDELSYLSEFEHIIFARVLLAEYQSKRVETVILAALNLLERLLKAAEDGKRMGSVLEILMTQVLVYQAKGDTSQTFVSLERALTLAEPEGYVRTFVDEGDLMRSLLLDYRKSSEKQPRSIGHELTSYIDKLISAFAQPKDILQSNLVEPLSQRELEVLRLIAQGLSNREISERLFLALSSVKGHNQMIFSKLQVQSRTEAVARARELSLL